ncbi:MAG: response regulator [Bacteroidia bacterium]
MDKGECIPKNIYLADDDEDDRSFFQDALKEVCKDVQLTMAINGSELMTILYKQPVPLPDVLFLDLNMPIKNGFECLAEIRANQLLNQLPVIIFSTTSQEEAVNMVYNIGANLYVRKPDSFVHLKKILKQVLSIDWVNNRTQFPKEQFLVSMG